MAQSRGGNALLLPRYIVGSALLFLAVLPSLAIGQTEVYSPIVGFTRIALESDSDTVISVGFHDTPSFKGKSSASVASGSETEVEVTIAGTPGFSVDDFQDSHYLRVRTGDSAGRLYPIVSNAEASVTVAVQEAAPLTMAVDDQISIIPMWTLDALLPPASQEAELVSTGDLTTQRALELFLYENGTGTDLSPTRIFYLTDSGWRESIGGFPDASLEAIPPHSVLVFRARTDQEDASDIVFSGVVNEQTDVIQLATRDDGPQDTFVGLSRPVAVKVSELGLEGALLESANTSPESRVDELLVFTNTETLVNRQPAQRYFRSQGGWVRDEAGFPDGGDDAIPAGAALIVRLASTTTGEPRSWSNEATY